MGPTETVFNIVDAHKLNEVPLSKKEFMGCIKAYLKRVVGHMKENGKDAEAIKAFQAGATILIKELVEKYEEVQTFCGQGFDTEGALCFAYTYEGEEEPTMLYLLAGLKDEKFWKTKRPYVIF